MKKRFLIATIVASVGLVGCGNNSTGDVNKDLKIATKGVEQSASNENIYEIKDSFEKGVVDSIVDGDSLRINWSKDGSESKTLFSLEGINAPEITHNVFNKMPYGEESKKNLEDLAPPGDEVYIEFLEGEFAPRAFIYVKIGDKVKQLNNEQIKSGLAYVNINELLSKEHEENKNIIKLKETENQAKKQSLGIWSEKDFVVDGMFNKKYVKEGKEELYEERKRDPKAKRATIIIDRENKKATVVPND